MGGSVVDGFLDYFQLDAFFRQSAELKASFPREVMLTEGIILGALGGGFALFLLIFLLRRSAIAAIAASVAGMTFLIEAMAFGRLENVLPDGGGLVLFALLLSSVILFLTATVRAAKENVAVGVVFLLAIVAAIALGVAGYLGVYPADLPLRLAAGGLALFAVLLTMQQAATGDRRSLHIAPGVLIAACSLVVFFVMGSNGVASWIEMAVPHGMLAGGVLLAGLMSLLPAGSQPKAAKASPASGKGESNARKKDKALPSVVGAAPVMSMSDDEEEPEPDLPDAITDMAGEDDPVPDEESRPSAAVAGQSPISALWGHKSPEPKPAPPAPARNEVSELRAALGAAGMPLWDWKAPGQINASEETASLLGVSKISALSPENVRGLIDHDSLEQYDEEILGGGDPQTGRFDFEVTTREGRRLAIKGERQVDEEGFVDRIIAFVAPVRKAAASPALRATPAAPGITAEMIREGLENGEFEAWFQPVVRLNDQDIAGFEALARWRRPGGGKPMLPDQFMEVAIDAGLEMDITAVILSQAAAELAAWVGSSPAQGQFVSFNVSADTLINDRLVKLVRNTIRKHDLPDGSLVVELTETHVLHDQHKVLAVAKSMRQAGARIALDDLGAGQSTLGQLSKFRFDIIKTDRALLEAALRDDHGHTLLAGLVDMAHRMGTQIIVEGAETAEAVRMLREMKCDYAQGYYFGMPEPAGGAPEEEEVPRQPVTADLR
ncbi:EAL domain-containing protein [Parvularcula flava]|uniref:EAL domain-containing protein n=1 Tax=Aquisalinus luteolus TaxID=1566827 RepID=A0A8J3A0H5_9PROT|nr:EAL domain-containing protein [Aquisalinus luteolus]NHK26747.1 EAL domain-containing protein [Aquisalinus luteolus]GGH93291.1 hypothetical protein GCM10011355_04780 [Aquisalinus luteolus]